MFSDRRNAARILASSLARYKGHKDAVVLAIPRGGVVIGTVLAQELGLPLDVILTKKIGHPDNPEFAIGVVSLHGELIDEALVGRAGISPAYLQEQIVAIRGELKRRQRLYHGARPPLSIRGKTVIICDDGIATGHTMMAAIRLARLEGARRIVAAAPVGARDSVSGIMDLANETACVLEPENFSAIGEFYGNFDAVEDEEAIKLLEEASPRAVGAR